MKYFEPKATRLHLLPTPSAWTGVGSLIDVCGSLNTYNYSPTSAQADYDAMRSDWLAVGDYIVQAMERQYDYIERDSEWAKPTT